MTTENKAEPETTAGAPSVKERDKELARYFFGHLAKVRQDEGAEDLARFRESAVREAVAPLEAENKSLREQLKRLVEKE